MEKYIKKIETAIKTLILDDELLSEFDKNKRINEIKTLCMELKNIIGNEIKTSNTLTYDYITNYETAHHLITIFTLIDVKHYQYLELLLEGLNTLDDFYC